MFLVGLNPGIPGHWRTLPPPTEREREVAREGVTVSERGEIGTVLFERKREWGNREIDTEKQKLRNIIKKTDRQTDRLEKKNDKGKRE